jgi:hypothetical protein
MLPCSHVVTILSDIQSTYWISRDAQLAWVGVGM